MDDSDHNRPTGQFADRDRLRYFARKLQRHPKYLATSRVWRTVRKLPSNGWRVATHRFRELPSLVIVGAQKAGTTQLYEGLIRHPSCFGGAQKELNYFGNSRRRPLSWYRSRFPLTKVVRRTAGLCVEASPSYLPSINALHQMREVLPDVKIVAILRDPVSRAFSHYQHSKSRRRDSRSFAAAMREIIEQGTRPPALRESLAVDANAGLDYVSRGYYALQVEALWRLFPREQTLILDSADLFDDTSAVCQRVFEFVGLDRCDVNMKKVYNRGYYREAIDPSIAAELRDHYRPYDQLLAELTGQSFRWMDTRRAASSTQPRAGTTDRAA
jgi:hypothetical protein